MLLAAVLRVAVAMPGLPAPETAFFRPDTPSYLQPALALLEEGRYVGAPGETEPYTLRGPGYPAFLALVFGLLGKGLQLPVVLFCGLGALTCVPVFRVGCWFGGPLAGTLAALLLALNLTSIAHAPFYLSDTLFALVTAWMLYFFARFYFHGRLADLWLAVLLDAAGTLIRPTGLPWIVPCLFLVLVFQGLSVRRRLLGAAGCVLIFAAVLTPWMYRNSLAGGGFRLDTNLGNTLYYHNCAALMSVVTGVPRVTLRQRWTGQAEAEFAAHPARYADEDARTRYKLARAWQLIAAHKWTYLSLHFNPTILLPDAPAFYEHLGLTQAGRGTLDILHRCGVLAGRRAALFRRPHVAAAAPAARPRRRWDDLSRLPDPARPLAAAAGVVSRLLLPRLRGLLPGPARARGHAQVSPARPALDVRHGGRGVGPCVGAAPVSESGRGAGERALTPAG